MSGAFDKKTDGSNRRQARAEKELLEKKKRRLITTTVLVVLAVLFAGALFINSKFIRRALPAVTIGGMNFSAVEFDYFYNSAYLEFSDRINSEYEDMAYLLPSGRPFSNEMDYLTGMGGTWADFFTAMAIDEMSKLVNYYNEAKETGYELSAEGRQEFEDQIDSLRLQAMIYGFPSFLSFLQQVYGANINEDSFRKIAEFAFLARDYSRHVYSSFSYSESEIAGFYDENRDVFDIYTFRIIYISAEHDHDDEEDEEDHDAVYEAALAEAREKAAIIAESIESEDDFIAAAFEYDGERYEKPESTLIDFPGSWIGGDYEEWMLDPGRNYGDITTTDVDTGAYVIFYISRDPNEYRMTSMRQILIMPEELDPYDYELGEDDPQYLEDLDIAWADAMDVAGNVWAMFISGGATEEALMELMYEYSDDQTEGGLYEDISKDPSHRKMVREVEDFLFDPQRVYGDHELIKTEAYGYHLLFFMGHGERYCDYLAKLGMQERDYTDWAESFEDADITRRWAFILTMQ